MTVRRGTVVVAELESTIGHEQRGVWPCIIVSDPDVVADHGFRLVCMVPLTGAPGEGLLYPPVRARPERSRQEIVRADRPFAVDRQAAEPAHVRRTRAGRDDCDR